MLKWSCNYTQNDMAGVLKKDGMLIEMLGSDVQDCIMKLLNSSRIYYKNKKILQYQLLY